MNPSRANAGSVTQAPTRLVRLGRLVRRPSEMIEATRWLFALLTVISVFLGLSAALDGGATTKLIAVAASSTLLVSVIVTYLQRRVTVASDFVDAVALTAMALVSPDPTVTLSYVFASIWFRALYGNTKRSLLRCSLYAAALTSSTVLWARVPWHTTDTEVESVFGVFPTMFATVVVVGQLARLLHGRERAFARESIQASLGSRLLAVRDAEEIRRIGWDAMTDVCQVTPGLRVLKVSREEDALRVERTTGGFVSVPGRITAAGVDLPASDREPEGTIIRHTQELDAAAGVDCAWVAVPLPEVPDEQEDAWLLIGSPGAAPWEAVMSIRGGVSQVAMALRNSDTHHKLAAQAIRDSLTGLANRASFDAALTAALSDRRRPCTGLLFIDLDDFKQVNDELGHAAGDDLLREVARRLTSATRDDDVCARLGGDEFAVLLGPDASSATEIAERIVRSLARPVRVANETVRVSASVGVATTTEPTEAEELTRQADVAMYAAKANGKGRVQVFDSDLLHVGSSREFERALEASARHGELVVHYQPVLSLADRRCVAVEALVRWRHPRRGLLYPEAFIELAERTGAIREIGRFVLRQACADLAVWQSLHPGLTMRVHVNVSARQIDDIRFTEDVVRALAEHRLDPADLVLEITESLVVSETATARLVDLAALGITLAIDDSGTGYSALTTLRTLPIHIVKIDKSFVAGCTTNPEDRAVIEAVVTMAKQMGLQAIAEGVEEVDQQAFVQAVGADSAQGYLYLRPTTAELFGTWLDAHVAATRPAPKTEAGAVAEA